MAAKASGEQDVIADINIVPLVDIILVVLIIFMVTATNFSSKEIDVELPKASSGSGPSAQPLTVQVSAAGLIYLDGKETDVIRLREEAESRLSSNQDLQAVVSADARAPHGAVIQAMDAVKSAGVAKLAVSVEGDAI